MGDKSKQDQKKRFAVANGQVRGQFMVFFDERPTLQVM